MKVRITLYAFAMLFAVILAAISIVLTLDFGRYKADAENYVSNLLQREFRIEGPLHLKLGGTIALSAEQVSLASTKWASDPQMVSIRRIDTNIDTWSLFKGPIQVESLVLDGLRVNLQQDERGENNWTFFESSDGEAENDEASARPSLPVLADDVRITDAIVVYRNPDLAQPLRIAVDRLYEHILESQDLELTVDGSINDTVVDIDLIAGKIAGLTSYADVELRFQGQVGEIRFDGAASIADLLKPRRPTASIELAGPNIEYLTDLLGMQRVTTGPLQFDVKIAPDAERMGLNLSGTFGEFIVTADGHFVDLIHMEGIDVQMSASGPDIGRIGSIAGIAGVPNDPFDIVASVRRTGKQVSVEEFTVTIGETTLGINALFDEFPSPDGASASLNIEGPDILRFNKLLRIPGILQGPFRLAATLVPLDAGGASLSIESQVSDISYKMRGNLAGSADLVGSTAQLQYDVPDLRTLARALAVDSMPAISLHASADVERIANAVLVSDADIELGDDRISFRGQIGDEPMAPGTSLQFDAVMPDLQASLTRFGINLPQLPPGNLSGSGQIATAGERVLLKQLAAEFADLDVRLDADLLLASVLDDSRITFRVDGNNLFQLLPANAAFRDLNKAYRLDGSVRLLPDAVQISDLQFRMVEARVSGRVELGLETDANSARIQIEADLPDIYDFSPDLAKFTALKSVPLTLQMDIGWENRLLSIDKFHAEIGEGSFQISGGIDGPPDFGRTDLKIDLHVADMHNLSLLSGRDLPHEPARFIAHVVGKGQTVRLNELSGQFGESDFSGDFEFTAGDVPKIALKLTSQRLNLSPYLPPPEQVDFPTEPVDKPAVPEDTVDRVIPDAAIPFERLQGFAANADLHINEMNIGQHSFADIVVYGEVTDGSLSIREFNFTNGERGNFSGRLGIETGTGGADIWMRLFGRSLNMALPAETREELDALPRYDFELALIASGGNPREIFGALNGYYKLTMGPGRVKAGSMRMFTQDFLSQLLATVNPFVKSDPYTNVKCAAILATVEDGQLIGQPVFVAQTDQLNIFADAEIDLKTERLNADINTVPMKGLGISLSNLVNPYIRVGGTMARPVLGINKEGAVIEGGAAVATAGLSIIALGLKDRFLSDKDPCGSAISDAEKDFAALEEKYNSIPRAQN